MKILITGGFGFFGYHLANELLDLNCQITLIDISPEDNFDKDFESLLINKNVTYLNLDLFDQNSLDHLSKDYTHIIHLAAILGVQNVISNPRKVLTKNIFMLENIIKFANKITTKPTLIFASTSEVYAGTLFNSKLEFPTPEDSLIILPDLESPRTSYMLSKIYGEAMCHASSLKTIIIRPHNLYGPRMGMKHVIPQLIKKIYNAPPNSKLGVFSPEHMRTFCFIKDAVKQMRKLVIMDMTKNSQVFNLGTQSPEITMRALAKMLLKKMKRNDLEIMPLEETLGSPKRRCPLTKLADDYTSIKERTEISQGLEETYNWYVRNKGIYLA